jgi:MATE family multidrug resistance protein
MVSPAETTALARADAARGGVHEVAWLAYPIVLSNLSGTLMHVVDTAFVGRLGPVELAGVGYGGVLYWTVLCAFVGAATGVQTFVAQAHGAGRERECGAWAWQSLWLLAPLAALALWLYAQGFPALLAWLGPSPGLQGVAVEYVRPRAFGAGGVIAAMSIASFFRGVGDTRTPLVAMICANVLNAALAYGLIFGHFGLPAWGVAGAGTATAVAETAQAAVLLAAFRRARVSAAFATAPVRPRRRDVARLLRTSAPIGGQWLLDMVTFALFSTLVARMGDQSMAASQAFVTLLHLSFMQVMGVSVATGTLVGRYIGMRDLDAAGRSHASAQRLGIGLAVAVGVLFLAVPDALLGIFTDDPDVIALGRPLLAVGALYNLADAVAIVAAGALRGAGDTRWPFVAATLLAWLVFLPAAWLFGVALAGGLVGAWLGGTVYVLGLAVAQVGRLRAGAWRRIAI